MGKRYIHVTIEERCEMARLRAAGQSVRQIAAGLDRSPSTVARELKRNGSRTEGYQPVYANQASHARRWRGSKLDRDSALREQVIARLQQGWSPEQVSGRLALDSGKRVISHETIYRSYTPNWSGRRTTPGATTCLAGSLRGAGVVAGEETPLHSSTSDALLQNVPRELMTGRHLDTGRLT